MVLNKDEQQCGVEKKDHDGERHAEEEAAAYREILVGLLRAASACVAQVESKQDVLGGARAQLVEACARAADVLGGVCGAGRPSTDEPASGEVRAPDCVDGDAAHPGARAGRPELVTASLLYDGMLLRYVASAPDDPMDGRCAQLVSLGGRPPAGPRWGLRLAAKYAPVREASICAHWSADMGWEPVDGLIVRRRRGEPVEYAVLRSMPDERSGWGLDSLDGAMGGGRNPLRVDDLRLYDDWEPDDGWRLVREEVCP